MAFKACALTIPNDGSQDNNMADQPCYAGLERLQSLNHIVTGPRAHPFAGISVAVNLNDEAEMEFDPVKVISDGSALMPKILTLNIDTVINETTFLKKLKSPCSVYI